MSRLRKVDRAILELNEPLDSQDQELVIELLLYENNERYKLYRKVMSLAIVVEILPLAHAAKSTGSALAIMLSILSSVLLIASIWYGCRFKHVTWLDRGNAVVLAATVCILWRKSIRWQGAFVLVLVANLATLHLLRKWHQSVGDGVQQLHKLRYKYKSV